MLAIQNWFCSDLKFKFIAKTLYVCIPTLNLIMCLSHVSLASFLWDVVKQWGPRSDACKMWRLIRVSTNCLQHVVLKFEKNEKSHPITLKQKWTGTIDKSGKFHLV